MSKRDRYMTKMQVTYEMLESLIYLPDGMRLKSVQGDPNREIATFFIESDEQLREGGYATTKIHESQEIPNSLFEFDYMVEKMREKVAAYDQSNAEKQAEIEKDEFTKILLEVIKNAEIRRQGW